MPTAIDIITYIGVPLAVLGVLPILYTTLTSLLTLRRIKHELHHNGLHPAIRGSLMSRIVEIEFERYSITPLRRDQPGFWIQAPRPSLIKGGSWTLFNWEKLKTGRAVCRVEYADEVRQPQAEVDFEELVAFLLDRGAVPDPDGFSKLRLSGLWTPTGTRLLLSPDRKHSVLSVTAPDESDGHVSVTLKWRDEWDIRSMDSLPPYWMRISVPTTPPSIGNDTSMRPPVNGAEKHSTELESGQRPIRVRLGINGLQEAFYETPSGGMAELVPANHLKMFNDYHGPAGLWFACGATALGGQAGAMGLWSYSIPLSIQVFASKDTVPCGIMVLLGVIDEKDTPPWATQHDNMSEAQKMSAKFMKQQQMIRAESMMAPAQREAARIARVAEETFNRHQEMMQSMQDRRKHEEQRLQDALNSPRLSPHVVADANRRWLKKDGNVVETILHRMLIEEAFAKRISDMIEAWQTWSEGGGVTRVDWDKIRKDQEAFSYASCLIQTVGEVFRAVDAGLATDMKESMKSWPYVRVG